MTRTILLAGMLAALALAPATAQDADAARDAAIEELVETTQLTQMVDQMIGLFLRDVYPMLREENPGEDARLRAIIEEEVAASMREMKDEVVALTREVWARHFTTEEVCALTDFYRTPLGRKLLEKQPVIANESLQAGMRLSQEAAAAAMDRVRARLAAENLRVPQQL